VEEGLKAGVKTNNNNNYRNFKDTDSSTCGGDSDDDVSTRTNVQ